MSAPRRNAIFLSALICPGAGQWAQGRTWAALAYGGAFLFALVILAAIWGRYFRDLIDAFGSLLAGDYQHDPAVPHIRDLLRPLLVVTAIYAANVYDVWWANRKARAAQPRPAGSEP